MTIFTVCIGIVLSHSSAVGRPLRVGWLIIAKVGNYKFLIRSMSLSMTGREGGVTPGLGLAPGAPLSGLAFCGLSSSTNPAFISPYTTLRMSMSVMLHAFEIWRMEFFGLMKDTTRHSSTLSWIF